MVDVGYFALCLALAAAGYATVVSLLGAHRHHEGLIRSGENAVLAVCALYSVAALSLWYAIFTKDFQVQYVAENTNLAMPTQYVLASLWGGQNGSILFWGWVLAIYTGAAVAFNRHRYRELMPYVVAVLAASCFFFAMLNIFSADPFTRLSFTPADGRGLNPILQHPYMAIHPPLLYAGMVGMAVPFAFGIAALASRLLDNTWLRAMRRWLLIPWTFLGAGLLLGGKWAYVELGWGGYWGWDPVENASLMPWLAATALLHSVMIQERKGMLKVWNMVLLFFTFGMTIFGTFLTRSGIVSSVHAFAQSNIGTYFVVFLILIAVGSIVLLITRLGDLQADHHLESFTSRESAFLLNNWILLALLFAVLWGTMFPVLSEAFTGDKITVGAPFFNQVSVPMGLVLLFLTGAGPLFAWRRTSTEGLRRNFTVPVVTTLVCAGVLLVVGLRDLYAIMSLSLCGFVVGSVVLEFYRGIGARRRTMGEGTMLALFGLLAKNRRRYGGYLVHLSIILLFVGFTGQAFTIERERVLRRGESAQIGNYTVTFDALAFGEDANKSVAAAAVSLQHDGTRLATMIPERHFYKTAEQNTTEVSIYSRWLEDFYVIMVGIGADNQSAKFHIYINPLVNCVWWGSALLVFSSSWTMWPNARDRRMARLDRDAVRAGGWQPALGGQA
ncbi:MAG: heme lyase CcmF/NrfE family subunit [Candidatus Latescibacterota bacterium]|nr:heme lyase CcmF/NrfE family subunit [Candidatus Latescibacterota bacterium]